MSVRIALALVLAVAVAASWTVRGQEAIPIAHREGAAVKLSPTRHPSVPTELSQFWFVSHSGLSRPVAVTASSAQVARFARGVQLINKGDYAGGLPLVSSAEHTRTPFADYAQYYTGVALARLSRLNEAHVAFATVADKRPQGYLREAVSLRLAETALARGDTARAIELLEDLAKQKVASPDSVLLQLARAAERAGDSTRALNAYRRIYYELPLSSGAVDAQAALGRIETVDRRLPDKLRLDRERAQALFAAKRWAQARAAFEPLATVLQGRDARLVALRIAQCDYYLDRFRAARDALTPLLNDSAHEAEARHFHLSAVRGLGDQAGYVKLALALIDEHPTSPSTEETLNNLASHYIRIDDDAAADRVFRTLARNFPRGRHAERAAWRIGWRAYRQGGYREAAETFERAAATFPRADTRPAWLYWSARARDLLNEPVLAVDRYGIVLADYENSYYGRLALTALGGRTPSHGILQVSGATAGFAAESDTIPTDAVIRDLVALQLYEDALREVQYAQREWGDSAQLQATIAYIRHNQGLGLKAEERFNAVRGAITLMRRAYPQFMAAGGDELPPDVLRIIFPIDYWPLITKYSKQNGLDPFLVAALMAQESTFTAEIRSSANAYGLMQIIPATGSRYATKLGIRNFSTRMLTQPETNIRLGTEYFKDLLARFGGAHYALAGYNAGEGRVQQWLKAKGPLPADEFTDDIPFAETQTYVKRILGTAEDYRRLYGGGLLDPNASLSAQAAAAVAGSSSPAATPSAAKPAPAKPAPAKPAAAKPKAKPAPAKPAPAKPTTSKPAPATKKTPARALSSQSSRVSRH